MSNENFFKHDDKAYAENLNDAILIANAFDYQVPVNIPGMYGNNHYPNDNNIHKVGVADVTIISSGSLSIGDTSITNNSNTSQVLRLRVYPNFNSFYAWKKLNWTCTGDVTVNICDAGTSTSLLPSGALTNPDNETLLNGISNLQGLKEYDLLITIPVNGVLNTLSLVFVNNWNSNNRVSASINQSNVTGLVSDLSGIRDDLSSLESSKAPIVHNHTLADVVSLEAFPNIGTGIRVTQRVVNRAIDNKIGSLSTSITNTYHWNYQNNQPTSRVTYNRDGVVVNAYRRGNTVTVRVRVDIKYINMGSDTASLSLATLPSGYRPPIQLYSLNAIYPYYPMFRYGSVNTDGKINLNVKGATSVQTVNAWIDLAFTYVTPDDDPSQ